MADWCDASYANARAWRDGTWGPSLERRQKLIEGVRRHAQELLGCLGCLGCLLMLPSHAQYSSTLPLGAHPLCSSVAPGACARPSAMIVGYPYMQRE